MIFYGRSPFFVKTFEGAFECPNCGPANYVRTVGRVWWYVYFVPVVPRHRIDSLYCQKCFGRWDSRILLS